MHYIRYGSKYNNVKTDFDGYHYDSKKEATYAYELNLRKKAKEITDWKRQIRIPLRVNGNLITTYKIDFEVYYPDGTIEWVEVKGFDKDYAWRLRWKLLEAISKVEYPHHRLLVVK